jgi:hypothetical protein
MDKNTASIDDFRLLRRVAANRWRITVMKDPKASEEISLRPGDVLIVPKRIV